LKTPFPADVSATLYQHLVPDGFLQGSLTSGKSTNPVSLFIPQQALPKSPFPTLSWEDKKLPLLASFVLSSSLPAYPRPSLILQSFDLPLKALILSFVLLTNISSLVSNILTLGRRFWLYSATPMFCQKPNQHSPATGLFFLTVLTLQVLRKLVNVLVHPSYQTNQAGDIIKGRAFASYSLLRCRCKLFPVGSQTFQQVQIGPPLSPACA